MVDAGVIVRGFLDPGAAADARESAEVRRSAELLLRVARGETQIVMTDAAIAEVAIVLTSPRHYRLSRQDAAARMRALLSESGVRLSGRATVLAALDRWASDPAIGFSRALTVERAIEAGAMLADDFLPSPGRPRAAAEDGRD